MLNPFSSYIILFSIPLQQLSQPSTWVNGFSIPGITTPFHPHVTTTITNCFMVMMSTTKRLSFSKRRRCGTITSSYLEYMNNGNKNTVKNQNSIGTAAAAGGLIMNQNSIRINSMNGKSKLASTKNNNQENPMVVEAINSSTASSKTTSSSVDQGGDSSSATTESLNSSTIENSTILDVEELAKVNATFDLSPPLTFPKYLTMQEKRVPVVIRYSDVQGLRPFFLTAAKKIKSSNPDILVEKEILPFRNDASYEDTVFEVLVDGKVVTGKDKSKWQPISRSPQQTDTSNKSQQTDTNKFVHGISVYISMEEINHAIQKARKKRRPSTMYAQSVALNGDSPATRLEMLKGNLDTGLSPK